MYMIGSIVLVLTTVQALHLYEEVRTEFRLKFPLAEIPKRIFVTANIIGFAFALITACLCFVNARAGILAAWVYAILMLVNGVLHLGIMIIRRDYFPGGITACLILPAAIYLAWRLWLIQLQFPVIRENYHCP